MIKTLTILLVIFNPFILIGQSYFKNAKSSISLNVIAATDSLNPFWLRVNQYGEVPNKSNTIILGGAFKKEYDSTYNTLKKLKKFNSGFAIEALAATGMYNKIIVPVAHFKIRYSVFEVFLGRKKEIVGLIDSTLCSGSYAYSNNSIPIPKFQISIPNYVRIGKNGILAFKGHFAMGTLGNQYYVKNQFFHFKSLYARIGKPTWKINLFGGFTHQVMFGGQLNNITSLRSIASDKFPQSGYDFIYAISGITLNDQGKQLYLDPDGYTSYDLTNRVGNHFGNVDIGGQIFTNKVDIFFYRQSVYDDGSLFYLNNISDGLYGLSLQPKFTFSKSLKIKKIVLEYFNSSNQGGPVPPGKEVNGETRGADNYFNHGQFLDGWSYYNNTIGNPFISSYKFINHNLPQYSQDKLADKTVYFFTNNNRLKAIYLGTLFTYKKYDLKIKGSYSINYGTYKFPFSKNINQISMLGETYFPVKFFDSKLKVSFAYDSYGIFSNNFGTNIGLLKLL